MADPKLPNMEPDANMWGASSSECSLRSQAISMKRIADTLQNIYEHLGYFGANAHPRLANG